MKRALLVVLLACSLSLSQAEDWTTSDGTTYRNVTVLSHDDAYVTIMHDEGGGRVLLSTLEPDLQKRFGYDPAKAAACIKATALADQRDQAALNQEQLQQDAAIRSQTGGVAMAIQPAATPTAQGSPAAQAPTNVVPVHKIAAPAAPAVNVVANEAKIEDDQRQLDDLQVDLRVAQRDRYESWPYGYPYGYYWNGGAHYDNTGTLHPNRVGTDAGDRLPELLKRQDELQAEIQKLQDEDTKAQTASSP